MPESVADISVVICTRNRAESLRETLACLARADKTGLRCEVVVVDNGGIDHTAAVAREPIHDLPIHYLVEPLAGKSHALNRALADAPLGEIVAVLDDDMSPHPDWFAGVKAICDRWPDKDYFTGRSYCIWPVPKVPDWCTHPRLRGWAFSVMSVSKETEVSDGRWFSGNHFWFRSRVLNDGRRFETGQPDLSTHIEMSEPQFMLKLAEDGFGGLMAPDAVCGHRIQPDLLKFEVLQRRAVRVGRGNAVARLQPYKARIKQARLFRAHPFLSRLFCAASLIGWGAIHLASWLHPAPSARILLRLQSLERLATYHEYLRVAK